MLVTYPARYSDKFGEVVTSIENDGKILRMVARGVEFEGRWLDDWEPTEGSDPSKFSSFTFFSPDMLCSCVIACEMAIPVVVHRDTVRGTLRVHLELGNPRPTGGIDHEDLRLELVLGKNTFSSTGKGGFFEVEMLEIQRQLPAGVYMKACINCAFSDYAPGGNGMFGCMACFRDNKEAYRSVKGKADIFRVWDTLTEFVQETYLCHEFERRTPGTGYRG